MAIRVKKYEIQECNLNEPHVQHVHMPKWYQRPRFCVGILPPKPVHRCRYILVINQSRVFREDLLVWMCTGCHTLASIDRETAYEEMLREKTYKAVWQYPENAGI